MNTADGLHGRLVHPRRVQVLAAHAARLVPNGARVLDVGTGDGRIAAALVAARPDLRVEGIDVLVRRDAAIPVAPFDGRSIPLPARSVDVVTLFDVLHHADDPEALLAEASRVARSCVIVKDHVANGWIARAILAFMDDVGNRRHGVALPHHYLSATEWSAVIARLGLACARWDVGGLGLYPWPASLVFGGRLHVLARLDVGAPA
jgi:SAM-dependent methyltransferase